MQADNSNSKRTTVLVTGASSGIGREFAKKFAQEGYNLVLVGRDRAKLTRTGEILKRAYKIDVTTIVKDLAVESAAASIYAELKRKSIVVDVLVNNAGFGEFGEFIKSDQVRDIEMIRTNITAVTAMCRQFVPAMVKHKRGRVLNVASIAAFVPGPLMSEYYATKAYVLSFTQGLAEEVREEGVVVSALCPPPTKTNFEKKANLAHSALFRGRVLEASHVASIGYRGLMRGKRVIIPGLRSKMSVFVWRFVPRSLLVKYVHHLQRRLY